jgi:hypothetical protein
LANHVAVSLEGSARQRYNPRIPLQVPVMVRVTCSDRTSFCEDTSTMIVNGNGALVPLSIKLSVGDTIFVVNKSTQREQECRIAYVAPDVHGKVWAGVAFKRPLPNFWRVSRREARIVKTIAVKAGGVDPQGQPYSQSTHAIDISRRGVRLDGIGYLASPGDAIVVKRLWRTSHFRVMWIGQIGTPQAGQIGAFSIEPNKKFWGADLF